MQSAKRMVLVDEHLLDNLYRKHDLSWKRQADYTAKSKLNRQMKTDLENCTVSDDVKVKHYNQDLGRFLHTKRKLPASEPIKFEGVASENNIVTENKSATEKRKKKKPVVLSSNSRPKRLTKRPTFIWEEF